MLRRHKRDVLMQPTTTTATSTTSTTTPVIDSKSAPPVSPPLSSATTVPPVSALGTPMVALPPKFVTTHHLKFSVLERQFYEVLAGVMKGEFKSLVKYAIQFFLLCFARFASLGGGLICGLMGCRCACICRSDSVGSNYTRVLTMLLRLRQSCSHYELCAKPSKKTAATAGSGSDGGIDPAVVAAAKKVGLNLSGSGAGSGSGSGGAGGSKRRSGAAATAGGDNNNKITADIADAIADLKISSQPPPTPPPPPPPPKPALPSTAAASDDDGVSPSDAELERRIIEILTAPAGLPWEELSARIIRHQIQTDLSGIDLKPRKAFIKERVKTITSRAGSKQALIEAQEANKKKASAAPATATTTASVGGSKPTTSVSTAKVSGKKTAADKAAGGGDELDDLTATISSMSLSTKKSCGSKKQLDTKTNTTAPLPPTTPVPLSPLITSSSKLTFLIEQLSRIRREDPLAKCVVFSQWTGMLDLVARALDTCGYSSASGSGSGSGDGYRRLDGTMTTAQQQSAIRDFGIPLTATTTTTTTTTTATPQVRVFLISLKAGGVGLNLIAANHLFLLDLWWNPAIELQAFDRVHRVGQTKPVHVHRLVIADTVETKIVELQAAKARLADTALGDETEDGGGGGDGDGGASKQSKKQKDKLTLDDLKLLFS